MSTNIGYYRFGASRKRRLLQIRRSPKRERSNPWKLRYYKVAFEDFLIYTNYGLFKKIKVPDPRNLVEQTHD